MAHIYAPGNIWYETAEAYAKAVEQKSGGKVKMQIAPSGSTGDWPASIEALKIGTNDIVLQSVGTLDRYGTIAGVEAYPYLVRDVEHFKRVYYGPWACSCSTRSPRRPGTASSARATVAPAT
jgi:TRAP-type C4-dicarboxylate transport system substrate-binding protein